MVRSEFVAAMMAAAALPAWLEPVQGRAALVAEAPWPMAAESPEAALTYSLATAGPDPEDQTQRPADAVGAPIGVKVRFAGLVSDRVARVSVPGFERHAYARIDRLIPIVPVGARLVVAGGFGNEAAFYPALGTPAARAVSLATGTPLTALGTSTAPYDPDGADFVRLHVRVRGGPRRGKTGWLPAAYAGLEGERGEAASNAERACRCRILEFRASP